MVHPAGSPAKGSGQVDADGGMKDSSVPVGNALLRRSAYSQIGGGID